MKIRLFIFALVAISLTAACSPVPRYRTHPVSKPLEIDPADDGLTTNEYVRLGLILQSYLGKPYKGRSKWEEGLDCSKFTSEVFRKFNNTRLPRQAAAQFQEGTNIPRTRLRMGDLVFFETQRNSISHVGIAVSRNKFIHASTSRGVIISHLGEDYWAKRYAGARRILK